MDLTWPLVSIGGRIWPQGVEFGIRPPFDINVVSLGRPLNPRHNTTQFNSNGPTIEVIVLFSDFTGKPISFLQRKRFYLLTCYFGINYYALLCDAGKGTEYYKWMSKRHTKYALKRIATTIFTLSFNLLEAS